MRICALTKIFCYELRRLLLNKLFFGILLITLFYGYLTFTSSTILGAANTAPFSPWSFGDYLSRLLPVLCLGELFLLSFFTSPQERRAAVLTRAAPVSPGAYAAVRLGAVLLGTAALALGAVGLCWGLYAGLFRWTEFSTLLAPLLLTLVPAAVFCLGVGWALGQLHPALVYGLMAAVLLLSWAPLPEALSFSLEGFFTGYPRSLGTVDPAFSIPVSALWGRGVYCLLGTAALCWGQRRRS